MSGTVIAVNGIGEYSFIKPTRPSIRLLTGLGVEGDGASECWIRRAYSGLHLT